MRRAAACLTAGLALLSACGRPAPREPEALRIARADTLITAQSDLVGTPVDLAVGEGGRVYLLDYVMNRVVVFDGASGRTVRLIGREGEGPGEFRSPRALRVTGDTLRVVDAGNGRMQVLTADGAFVRSQALPVRATGGRIALTADGQMAIADPERGDNRLVTLIGASGQVIRSFGKPVVPQPPGLDFREIKREIGSGRIPRVLRNAASPVVNDDGSGWLVMMADGAIQRYDARGRLEGSHPLAAPEITAIRQAFFEKNRREQRPNAFFPLSYVADAARVGDHLWLLINTPEDYPAVLLLTDLDGVPYRRLLIPGAAGARQFAVDPTARRVYFAITSAASVVASPVPAGLAI